LENGNRKSFFEFKLFILERTFVGIRYHRASEFVDSSNLQQKVPSFDIRLPKFGKCHQIPAMVSRQRRNPVTSGHRRWILADQIQAESGRIWPKLPESDQIWLDPAIDLAKMAGIRQQQPDVARYYYFSFINFSYEPNTRKYFGKIVFSEKWFRRKIF